MRTRLVFVVFLACQLALLLGCSHILSWWDGP